MYSRWTQLPPPSVFLHAAGAPGTAPKFLPHNVTNKHTHSIGRQNGLGWRAQDEAAVLGRLWSRTGARVRPHPATVTCMGVPEEPPAQSASALAGVHFSALLEVRAGPRNACACVRSALRCNARYWGACPADMCWCVSAQKPCLQGASQPAGRQLSPPCEECMCCVAR